MTSTAIAIDPDVALIQAKFAELPDTERVASFVPNPHIERLSLSFDIERLKSALDDCLQRSDFMGDMQDQGFAALPLTRRRGDSDVSANDLSGRFWLRPDDTYKEVPREELVDEAAFSEFNPLFAGTYFETVHRQLSKRFVIGRMRILSKSVYNCNSWHRDPEPRLHIPIVSNPGSLFVVNNHVTHLPADGSVYFTDTRGYHMAMNGGEHGRVHIVAALVGTR